MEPTEGTGVASSHGIAALRGCDSRPADQSAEKSKTPPCVLRQAAFLKSKSRCNAPPDFHIAFSPSQSGYDYATAPGPRRENQALKERIEFADGRGSRRPSLRKGLHRQTSTADLAAMCQNLAAVGGGHTMAEAVSTLAGLVVRLESAFHGRYFLYVKQVLTKASFLI